MIYFLTAIGLTPGGSSTVHIYTQTVHRTTQLIWEECGRCPVFASYTLAFASQLRKKHGKTSFRVLYYSNNDAIKSTDSCKFWALLVHHHRHRWVDNIRMDLQEVGCGYVDWIGLAQDRDRWRTLVNAVMNLRVP